MPNFDDANRATEELFENEEQVNTDDADNVEEALQAAEEVAQAEQIANEYSFNQFNEYLITMLNNSFFANSTVESFENNVAKVVLNIGTYNIDSEEESEVLTTIFDGIKESNSVVLEVTYSETTVTNIKVTIDKDVVSTIELQLLGTASSEIAIEFPDFSGYTK